MKEFIAPNLCVASPSNSNENKADKQNNGVL